MSSTQGQLLAKLRHDAEQVIYQQRGLHSMFEEWSEVDPEFREVEALTMDEVLKSNLLDRKYNELVALIWHKIGNGEDGNTPIEKLISDFSDEHYKLFNTFRDREATIVDLTEKLDRAERALKRAGYQDLGAQEWKPPLGLSVQAIRNAWLDAEVVGNSWDGAKAVHDLYLSVKRSVDEKCPKCFDTGTIMMIGGPAQACDCKTEISTSKAFQMEPGTRSRDEDVMESVDQVEALARVLREACADHCKYDAVGLDLPVFIAEARAAIAHLSTRPEGLPTAEELAKVARNTWHKLSATHSRLCWEDAPELDKQRFSACAEAILTALRPWLRDPVGCDLDVTADEIVKAIIHDHRDTLKIAQAVLDLCRNRIRPVYECKGCAGLKQKLHHAAVAWRKIKDDEASDALDSALEGE